MTQIKPLSSMETPRFADVATFFRLPIIKDLNKLDYCVAGIPWDGGTCLLYTSPSPRDLSTSRMPSSA